MLTYTVYCRFGPGEIDWMDYLDDNDLRLLVFYDMIMETMEFFAKAGEVWEMAARVKKKFKS